MKIEDLDYHLPEELIAREPAQQRDASRLMLVDRRSGEVMEHAKVSDLPRFLKEGDLLVLNQTKVLPARFNAQRAKTGGKVEGLFLETRNDETWSVLLKSKGKLQKGEMIELVGEGLSGAHQLELLEKSEDASWSVKKHSLLATDVLLDQIGSMPLPPYIVRQRKLATEAAGVQWDELKDRERYQTVYAKQPGAVAAPTAGLHFTDALLDEIAAGGVGIAKLTLHVGMGTFQPVREEVLEDHPMHQEWFEVLKQTQEALVKTRERGGRVIAVGTTCVRSLESLPKPLPLEDYQAETELLISPGFQFEWTDGLMTNFHLPKSTLLALVGALCGLEELKAAYAEAIRERYRFYSYGDAMLFL